MQERVIKVFFGEDCLPYKDSERSVHFPILGSAFMNASNTTEIRFYCKDIGGDNRTWIVIGKLPNGKRGFKFLGSSQTDSETGEKYFSFHLNQFFTQYKGDLYLSLGGYSGSLEELSEYDTYELSANAIVETTGAIKLNIAYATPLSGSDTEIDTWQGFLAELGTKANKDQVIIQYETYDTLYSEKGNFNDGQLFYCQQDDCIYKKDSSALVLVNDIAIIKTNSVANGTILDKNKVALDMCFVVFTSTNVIYRKTGVEGGVAHFVSELEFVDGNNNGNDTFGRSQFDVTLSSGAITNSELYSKDIYNKDQIDNQFYTKAQAESRYLKKTGDTATGEIIFNNELPKTNASYSEDTPKTALTSIQKVEDILSPHLDDYNDLNDIVNGNESEGIVGIVEKIPTNATATNQLATESFVNSSIQNYASYPLSYNAQGDNFPTKASLTNAATFYYDGNVQTPTRNDYVIVENDESKPIEFSGYTNFTSTHDYVGYYVEYNSVMTLVTNQNKDSLSIVAGTTIAYSDIAPTTRYTYTGTYPSGQWKFITIINNSPFTDAQNKAINSGITEQLVAQIGTNQTNIATLNGKMPKVKDFTISSSAWQLDSVSGRYYCEIDAGGDFVFTDTQVKYYSGISANDQNIISVYGVIVSSSATTQKFRFECYRNNVAPSETLNYTICIMGE